MKTTLFLTLGLSFVLPALAADYSATASNSLYFFLACESAGSNAVWKMHQALNGRHIDRYQLSLESVSRHGSRGGECQIGVTPETREPTYLPGRDVRKVTVSPYTYTDATEFEACAQAEAAATADAIEKANNISGANGSYPAWVSPNEYYRVDSSTLVKRELSYSDGDDDNSIDGPGYHCTITRQFTIVQYSDTIWGRYQGIAGRGTGATALESCANAERNGREKAQKHCLDRGLPQLKHFEVDERESKQGTDGRWTCIVDYGATCTE